MKRVPWFDDPLRRITALSFDDEGTLYIGGRIALVILYWFAFSVWAILNHFLIVQIALDGSVIEIKALRVLSDQRDVDVNTLYRLLDKVSVWKLFPVLSFVMNKIKYNILSNYYYRLFEF